MGIPHSKRSKSEERHKHKSFSSFREKKSTQKSSNGTNSSTNINGHATSSNSNGSNFNNQLNLNSSFSESFNSNVLKSKTTAFENDYIYLNKGPLGKGINGDVILVINKYDKKKYALKRIIDSKNARREVTLQWRSAIDCQHIVKIKDIYENKLGKTKYLFVVMEYMEGGELFDKIKKRTKKPFTEQEVAKIMLQICKAVNHIHSLGIAHRDLKPENILLATKEDDSLIKLSDFGFAKEANEGLITPNYTPYYAPPEILRFQKYDISCDIWSLGVIMYILCCGYPPFYSTQGKRLSPGMEKRIKRGQYDFPENEWGLISDQAKSLIDGMLETQPDRRLTIDKIIRNKWLLNHTTVPTTKLNSIKIMNNNKQNWHDVLDSMNNALNEMRVNYEQDIRLKNLTEINNPLFQKRLAKAGNKKLKIEVGTQKIEPLKSTLKPSIVENIETNLTLKPSIVENMEMEYDDKFSNSSRTAIKIEDLKLKRQYSAPVKNSTLKALYYSFELGDN